LGKDVKSKIGVSECAVANSVVPFFLVPFMLLLIPEYNRWGSQLLHPGDPSLTTILTLLFLALCFSKHIDRLSKFGIVDESSTIFFAGVDAQMKMIAGIGSFFFFGESINWCIIVGFALVALAVVVMFIDKLQKQRMLQQEQQKSIAEKLKGVVKKG
jgi:drug/metabolite transporter (DMT)-like permease